MKTTQYKNILNKTDRVLFVLALMVSYAAFLGGAGYAVARFAGLDFFVGAGVAGGLGCAGALWAAVEAKKRFEGLGVVSLFQGLSAALAGGAGAGGYDAADTAESMQVKINADGTPMAGGVDIYGRNFGVTGPTVFNPNADSHVPLSGSYEQPHGYSSHQP